MKFVIDRPLSLYQIGRRANQEDALWPVHGTAKRSDRLFVVCDGIGGHDNGEVASKVVAEALAQGIASVPASQFGIERFNHAMNAAYYSLDAHDIVVAGRPKMGTTMAVLYLYDGGAFVAHIGDCRVYQVRPSTGQVIFRTDDHTLVSELFRAHRVSADALDNPAEGNVLTRAMLAHSRKQPADTAIITDVRPGDLFFVSTHGMFAGIKETEITQILVDPTTTSTQKMLAVKRLTDSVIDNHSCYLISIIDAGAVVTEPEGGGEEVYDEALNEIFATTPAAVMPSASEQMATTSPGTDGQETEQWGNDPWLDTENDEAEEAEANARQRKSSKWLPLIIAMSVFALAAIGGLVWYFGFKKGTGSNEKPAKGGYLEEVSLTDISKDTTRIVVPNGNDSVNMPPVSGGGSVDVKMPKVKREQLPKSTADPLDGFGLGDNSGIAPAAGNDGENGGGDGNNTGAEQGGNEPPAANNAPVNDSPGITYGTNPPPRSGGSVARPGTAPPPPRKKRDPREIPTAPPMPM